MKTTAIIIARGGSARLPNKNLLDFHGRSLVAHKVWQLKQCELVDEVVVGSDSTDILITAEREGAKLVHREPEFCDEKSRSWNEVIYDMVTRVQGDVVLWAHCTNPCIRPATYDRALRKFLHTRGDSIVGVTPFHNHVWWQGKPLNFDPYTRDHVVAAQLPPVYFQNGGLFIAHRIAMQTWSYVYGPHPEAFEIDPEQATDIDTQEDYARAVRFYSVPVRR